MTATRVGACLRQKEEAWKKSFWSVAREKTRKRVGSGARVPSSTWTRAQNESPPRWKNCKLRTKSWIDYTQCINIHRLIMHTVQSQTLFPSVNIWSSIFLKSLTKALFWYRWMPTLLFSICVVGIGGCLIDESLAGMKLPHHPAYVWSVCVFEEFWLGTWTLKCRKPKNQSGQNKLILLTNITIVKHNFVHLTICKFVNLQILSLRRREPLLQLCPPPFILAINTGLAIYF